MALSFVVVSALYFAVAYVAARSDLDGYFAAPFVVFVRPLLGAYGAVWVAVIAGIIVFANLSAALWGVSRMVYSLACNADLPKVLSATKNGKPMTAVLATLIILVTVLFIYGMGWVNLETMISIAGQNFLILYGLAGVSLFVMSKSPSVLSLATLVVIVVVGLMIFQGLKLAYPAGLILIASVVRPAKE
jgi:amino acid efflux transporter